DEFLERVGEAPTAPSIGTKRAEQLYERVFSEYGDDSVAQLGGVHLACEGASNVLTKVLEWGRLMAYLEQSTRYVPYTDRPDGRWRAAGGAAARARGDARGDRGGGATAPQGPRPRPAPRGHAHGLRPRGRGQGGGGAALSRVRSAGRPRRRSPI